MNDKGIHIDADLESKASAVLNSYGLDINDAITDYLNMIIINNNIKVKSNTNKVNKKELVLKRVLTLADLPDEERERRLNIIHTEGPTSEAIGVLKGMVWMADDFDEPLDCLQDYME